MTEPTRTALVVEDESAQRVMYTKALTTFGYTVYGAECGAEAWRELAAHPISVVILDLNLSGEDGLELFEQMRDRYPAISVIIATGYGTFEAVKRAIRMDAVDFLSKPISLERLEEAVDRAWARCQLVQTPVDRLVAPDGDDPTLELSTLVSRTRNLNLEAIERAVILEALRRNEDNRKTAATELGISERTLYYRLSQYRVRTR